MNKVSLMGLRTFCRRDVSQVGVDWSEELLIDGRLICSMYS